MGPQFEWIVDVSISPLNHVWGNLSKEEEKCIHLNAQAYVVLVSALSKGDAHLLWTKLKEKFDKSIGDDEVLSSREPLEVCSTPYICEEPQVTSSINQVGLVTFTSSPTFELMQGNDMVSRINVDACTSYGTCKTNILKEEEAYDHHQLSDESISPKHSLPIADRNMCFMVKNKKKLAKDEESESGDEDLEFDHLGKKDMLKKIEELKALTEKLECSYATLTTRYDELKIEYTKGTKSSSYVIKLEKVNDKRKSQVGKLISKYEDLQGSHDELLRYSDELMDSYVMLEIAHEVVLTTVKSYQPLTQKCTSSRVKFDLSCANHCCSQAKQSSVEHDLVQFCDDLIAKVNDDLKQEVEKLKKDLMSIKGKDIAQPSQDNREVMVDKLAKGSTNSKINGQDQKKKRTSLTCFKCKEGHHVRDCHLKKEGKDKSNGKKEKKKIAHVKCNKCSSLGHYASMCLNKNGDSMTSRKRFTGKETSKKQDKKASCNEKHRICHTCRAKGHIGKNCPMGNHSKPNLVNNDFDNLRKVKNGSCASKVIGSPHASIKSIWVPKSLVTNLEGPNMGWVPKCA
ncbi:hypothetical protein BS78_K330600 [Paspalum vaginatum]|uniref:CCHC-type domain-containing protein n=1 Tax=Paspalum vaginatum TaxID=158149 RepID=A0A9W8CEQ8_9POAL|nr:hypothetical protein BS78_K330600 [Paspalum vaginatum]